MAKKSIHWSLRLTPEQKIHLIVADTLNASPLRDCWRWDGAGAYKPRGNVVLFREMGLSAGWPDIMIYKGFRRYSDIIDEELHICGLAMELKAKRGVLSEQQLERIRSLRECGWDVCVPRSVEEAVASINNSYGLTLKPVDMDRTKAGWTKLKYQEE